MVIHQILGPGSRRPNGPFCFRIVKKSGENIPRYPTAVMMIPHLIHAKILYNFLYISSISSGKIIHQPALVIPIFLEYIP